MELIYYQLRVSKVKNVFIIPCKKKYAILLKAYKIMYSTSTL